MTKGGLQNITDIIDTQESVYIFLDTMVYLQIKAFDDIDWRKLLEAEWVTIINLPIIIGEIDKHKDTHSNQKIRKRSKSIGKIFHALFESDLEAVLHDHVTIKYEAIEPKIDFQAHNSSRTRFTTSSTR